MNLIRWSWLVVVAGGCVLGATPAVARLGETREQCQGRYGEPLAEVPPLLETATSAAYLFKGIRLRIEFLEERAAFISFSRAGLRHEEREILLAVNAGPLVWNPPAEFVGRMCWTAPASAAERPRHATAYQAAEIGYLDLATDAWTKAMKSQLAVQFAIQPRPVAPVVPAAGGPAAPAVPAAKGKLEGF